MSFFDKIIISVIISGVHQDKAVKREKLEEKNWSDFCLGMRIVFLQYHMYSLLFCWLMLQQWLGESDWPMPFSGFSLQIHDARLWKHILLAVVSCAEPSVWHWKWSSPVALRERIPQQVTDVEGTLRTPNARLWSGIRRGLGKLTEQVLLNWWSVWKCLIRGAAPVSELLS